MRQNLDPTFNSGEEDDKAMRLLGLLAGYDASDDPIHKQRLVEEIRQLKKELLQKMGPFKNINCMVAGDKDTDTAQLVVCAEATPDAFRVDGTIEVACSKCGKIVLLSPDSPRKPPKVCMDCAIACANKFNMEDGQESLGA